MRHPIFSEVAVKPIQFYTFSDVLLFSIMINCNEGSVFLLSLFFGGEWSGVVLQLTAPHRGRKSLARDDSASEEARRTVCGREMKEGSGAMEVRERERRRKGVNKREEEGEGEGSVRKW